MSLHESLSQTLVFGQLLGLMPISRDLKFHWKTFRFAHFVLVSCGALFFLISIFIYVFSGRNYSLDNFIVLTVYLFNFVTIILFAKLVQNWPKVIKTWEKLSPSCSQVKKNELSHQLNLRLLVIATSSLGKSSSHYQ